MGHSWSGIKKRLEQDLLCEELRGRVSFFITKYRKAHDDESRIAILIDKKEILQGNVYDFYRHANKLLDKIRAEENIPRRRWDGEKILYQVENNYLEKKVDNICVNKGIIDTYLFSNALDYYMNNPIEKSLESINPIVRMFAIMDRRIGKRTLLKLRNIVDEQPSWLQQFYILRLDAEGII